MNTKWIADLSIEDKTESDIVVNIALSQSDSSTGRDACVTLNHFGTNYGIQLESMDELDELIAMLTSIRDRASKVPEWRIFD